MKKVALPEVKDDLSGYLIIAEKEGVIITMHGKPAGILIGFESDENWFEYLLENDPRLLKRIESTRSSMRSGKGLRIEEL